MLITLIISCGKRERIKGRASFFTTDEGADEFLKPFGEQNNRPVLGEHIGAFPVRNGGRPRGDRLWQPRGRLPPNVTSVGHFSNQLERRLGRPKE